MERNIAALLRDDARTVRVAFNSEVKFPEKEPKLYTYITHLALVPGDYAVVPARGTWKVVDVIEVDESVQLEPNDTIRYSWVVCKVDMDAYRDNAAQNEQIEALVNDAYKNNLRRGFQAQILGGLPDDSKAAVLALLGPKPAA